MLNMIISGIDIKMFSL